MEGAASIASESFPSVEAGTSPRCLSSVAHTLWVQGSEREERALGAGLLWAAVSGEEGRRGEEKASLTPCASPPGSSNSAGRRRLSAPHAPSLCRSLSLLLAPAELWVLVLLLSLPELSSCRGCRHDRRPASARLQPEGGVRAPGALLPGSAGGAWEQAAPQHRRPALGSRAQQAAPPKGASGGLEGQKGERLEELRGLGAGGLSAHLFREAAFRLLPVESWDRAGVCL